MSRIPVRSIAMHIVIPMLLIAGVEIIAPSVAGASGTSLLTESFTNSTLSTSSWSLPTGSGGVCLTAGSNTSQTPVPDCSGSGGDANGSGALQLTNNAGNQVGTIFSTTALPTANGLDVSWNSYQFNGTGADGISFDLAAVNPTNPVPPTTTGPSGGSLGYAANIPNNADGMPYGYLGFGADVFGNYESSTFSGNGCSGTTSAVPESMGVRGPGNGLTGYCLLAQNNLASPLTLDSKSATARTGLAVPEEVVLNTSSSAITATASGISVPAGDYLFATEPLNNGSAGTVWQSIVGALPTNLTGFPTAWLGTNGLPKEMAFGWASSTGGSNEFHQINVLQASSVTPAPALSMTNTDSGSGTLYAESSDTVTLTPGVSSTSSASETQPVTVTDTFPSNLTPTAATGTGWTCSISGQAVSCNQTATSTVAAGSNYPAISVSVNASATTGTFLNSATVTSSDGAPATASDSGSIIAPLAQTINFTNTLPTNPKAGDTYTVTATGGASGNPVTFTVDSSSTSGCTIASGVVTLTTPAGTCVIDANQAGSGNYAAATQAQQSVTSTLIAQTINFTSSVPSPAYVGFGYTAVANGGASGNPITFSVDVTSTSSCTVNVTTGAVSFGSKTGTCIIDANQIGGGNYAAANKNMQTSSVVFVPVIVYPSPTVTISSPSGGGSYTVGQPVPTSFSCASAVGGPAIATCSDGSSKSGNGTLSTTTPGTFTYTVTATTTNGQSGTASITYTVTPPVVPPVVVPPVIVRPVVHPKPVVRPASTMLYYANNSWALSVRSKNLLNSLAHKIKANHLNKVIINGYASSPGTSSGNRVLGVNRAGLAARYLRWLLAKLHVRGVSFRIIGRGGMAFVVKPYNSPLNRRTDIIAR